MCNAFFWRDSANEPIRDYWLKVVTYDMTPSAFNAVQSVTQRTRNTLKYFPDASKVIKNYLNLDDCTTRSANESKAIKFPKCIHHILKVGGFEIKKRESL